MREDEGEVAGGSASGEGSALETGLLFLEVAAELLPAALAPESQVGARS